MDGAGAMQVAVFAKQGGRRRAVSRTRHGTRGRHGIVRHFDDDEGLGMKVIRTAAMRAVEAASG